jgi:hypothetical protein
MNSKVWVFVIALAGCYAPNYGNGELVCAADGTCPDGLTCKSDNRCYADGSGPAADASVADTLVEDVPDVTITFPTDGSTTGAMIAVMFESTAGADFTYECTMDGAASTCTSGKMYTLDGGSHTFSVRAVGPNGTKGNASSVTWTVDTMAATVTITGTPADASYTASKSASYTFSALPADNVTFECKVDNGAFAACTSPQSLSSLAEGPHTFTVQATRFGVSTTTSRTWTVDSIAPASPSFSGTPAAGALVKTTTASFTFSATDANTITYECSRDGAAYAACTSPQMYDVTGDGAHSFAARAKDPAGNTTQLGTRSWTVDTTPPNTTLTQNILAATNQTSVTFSYSSTEAGSTFTCTLDGVARSCTGTSHAISGLAIGSHTFSIAAVDQAGNADPTPATHTFQVTTSPLLRYAFEGNPNNTGAIPNTPTSFNGTQSSVSYASSGKFGNAVTFLQSDSSYVTLPVSPLIRTGRAYTVSIWWREPSVVNGSPGPRLISFPGTNRLEGYHGATGTALYNCVSSIQCNNFSYTVNSFNNLIYRYTGAGAGVQVYLNNVLQFTLNGPPGDLFAALGNPEVGTRTNMTVDEIRFYDQVYTTATQCTQVIGGTWTGSACTLP